MCRSATWNQARLLEPLKDWSFCPLEVQQALLELLQTLSFKLHCSCFRLYWNCTGLSCRRSRLHRSHSRFHWSCNFQDPVYQQFYFCHFFDATLDRGCTNGRGKGRGWQSWIIQSPRFRPRQLRLAFCLWGSQGKCWAFPKLLQISNDTKSNILWIYLFYLIYLVYLMNPSSCKMPKYWI